MSKNLEYFTRIRSIFKNDKLSASFGKLLNFKLGTRSESKGEDRNNKKSNAEIQLVKLTKFSQVDDSDNSNYYQKKEKEIVLKPKKSIETNNNN